MDPEQIKERVRKARNRKEAIEILGDEAKALPIYAAAVAWEDFAKRLEKMGAIENFRTVRFWDVIVAYYASYVTGLNDWKKHGMPAVDVLLPCEEGAPSVKAGHANGNR